jgi:hypothetical protein
MANGLVRAKEGLIFDHDGVPYVITRGQTVREGHPMLRGREASFEPFLPDYDWGRPTEAGEDDGPTVVNTPRNPVRADQRGARSR